MNKGSRVLELRPNRLLLDDSFGGYKLSLDPVPIYRKPLDTGDYTVPPPTGALNTGEFFVKSWGGVKVMQPSDDQFSFYHVKMFSLHNHLHVNPYKPDSVYFVDKNWRVIKVSTSPPNQAVTLKEVLQLPSPQEQATGCYNVSLAFPLPEVAIVCDGNGVLLLAEISGQQGDEVWRIPMAESLFREGINCALADARIECDGGERSLHVLLLFVEEKGDENGHGKGSLFQTKLKWRTFVEREDKWEKGFCKELCINGSVDYVALAPGCKSLYIVSDKPAKWVSDSEKPLECNTDAEVESLPEQKLYSWSQTAEEITIWVPVAEGVTKGDLCVSVDDGQLEIKVKEQRVVSGQLFHRVSKELTAWVLEKDRAEVQLTKVESGLMWKCLVPGDERGEEILEPEVVKYVHEKLAHLCSDKQETGSAPSFNSLQLEECDAVSCDTASLFRVSGDTHVTSHEVSLSSLQWLFKVWCSPGEAPGVCVRHDVDACVWQFSEPAEEGPWPHKHIGTFSAFGYVQASKTQKKFMASPSDLSYVAILEASHHIYIYRQPSPLTTELKNRHTGKKVDTISKQQLVNLEIKDHILGVHATSSFLFVLLENSVCVLLLS